MTPVTLVSLLLEDVNPELLVKAQWTILKSRTLTLDGVKKFLALGGDPNVPWPTEIKIRPLHYFCGNTNLSDSTRESIIRLLLDSGADPNIKSQESSVSTPLHIAAIRGYSRLVQILLKAGANPKIKDGRGKTALWYAHGDTKAVLHLKQATGS